MEFQHVNIKIPVDGDLGVDPVVFIDVFHKWIQTRALDELLIDVADYRHVPNGPGVMLIGLQADYSMDHARGAWGLRYNQKSPQPGSNADRFSMALRRSAAACRLMVSALAERSLSLRFSRHEFELFVNDRALAPNSSSTFDAARPELESFIRGALGHGDYVLTHDADARHLFGVRVRTDRAFETAALTS